MVRIALNCMDLIKIIATVLDAESDQEIYTVDEETEIKIFDLDNAMNVFKEASDESKLNKEDCDPPTKAEKDYKQLDAKNTNDKLAAIDVATKAAKKLKGKGGKGKK